MRPSKPQIAALARRDGDAEMRAARCWKTPLCTRYQASAPSAVPPNRAAAQLGRSCQYAIAAARRRRNRPGSRTRSRRRSLTASEFRDRGAVKRAVDQPEEIFVHLRLVLATAGVAAETQPLSRSRWATNRAPAGESAGRRDPVEPLAHADRGLHPEQQRRRITPGGRGERGLGVCAAAAGGGVAPRARTAAPRVPGRPSGSVLHRLCSSEFRGLALLQRFSPCAPGSGVCGHFEAARDRRVVMVALRSLSSRNWNASTSAPCAARSTPANSPCRDAADGRRARPLSC